LHLDNPGSIPGKVRYHLGEVDTSCSGSKVIVTITIVVMEMDMKCFPGSKELLKHPVEVGMPDIKAERKPCLADPGEEFRSAEMAHLPAPQVLHRERHAKLVLDRC
jgi:hypothetical protein